MLSLDIIKKIYALAVLALKKETNPASWGVVSSDFFRGTYYFRSIDDLKNTLNEVGLALTEFRTKAANANAPTLAEPDSDQLVELNNKLAIFIFLSLSRMDYLSDKAYLALYEVQTLFATETVSASKVTYRNISSLQSHQIYELDQTQTLKQLQTDIAAWRDTEKTLQAEVKLRAAFRSHGDSVLGSAKILIDKLTHAHALSALGETLAFAREYAKHINIDFSPPVSDATGSQPAPVSNLSLQTKPLSSTFLNALGTYEINSIAKLLQLSNNMAGALSHRDMIIFPSFDKIEQLDNLIFEALHTDEKEPGKIDHPKMEELMRFSYEIFSILSTSSQKRFIEANGIYSVCAYATLLHLRKMHTDLYNHFYSANQQLDTIKNLEHECQRLIGRCGLLKEEIAAYEKDRTEILRKLRLLFEIKMSLSAPASTNELNVLKETQAKAREISAPVPSAKVAVNKPTARRAPARVSSSSAQLFAVAQTAPVKPPATLAVLPSVKP